MAKKTKSPFGETSHYGSKSATTQPGHVFSLTAVPFKTEYKHGARSDMLTC
jgi:hypothetical protein